MSIQSKNTLKYWFIKYAKPTASQFADLFDSFWHKSESIPINKIDGLEIILNSINPISSNQLVVNTIEVSAVNAPTGNFNAGVKNTLHKVSYYDSGLQINFNVSAVTAENGDWMGVEDTQGFGVILGGSFQGNVNNVSIVGGNGTGGATAYFHYNDGAWRLVCINNPTDKRQIIEGTYAERLAINVSDANIEGLIFKEISGAGILQSIWVVRNHNWEPFVDTQSTVVEGDLRPVNSVAVEAYVSSKNNKTVYVDGISGNDTTAVKYSKTLMYKSIYAASLTLAYGDSLIVRGYSARYPTDSYSESNAVIYTEENIPIVDGTTVYLEDGVIIKAVDKTFSYAGRTITVPNGGQIFISNPNSSQKSVTWQLLGRGTLISNGNTDNDYSAISIRHHNVACTGNFYVEAKEITTINTWGNDMGRVKIKFNGVNFKNGATYGYFGSTQLFENCTFENSKGFTRDIGSLSNNGGLRVFKNCNYIRSVYPYPIETVYTDTSDGYYLFGNPGWGYPYLGYANRDTVGLSGFEGFSASTHIFQNCSFTNLIGGNGITLETANPAGSVSNTVKLLNCNFYQNDTSKFAVVIDGVNNGATATGSTVYTYFANNLSNTTPIQVISPAVFTNQLGGGNGFTQISPPDLSSYAPISYVDAKGVVNGTNWVMTNDSNLLADSNNIIATDSVSNVYTPAIALNKYIIVQAFKVPSGTTATSAPSDVVVNVTINNVYLNGANQAGNTSIQITNTNQVVHLLGTPYGWHVVSHSNVNNINTATQTALDSISKKGTLAERLSYANPTEGMTWEEVDGSGILQATYKYKNGVWKLATQPSIACYYTIPRCDIIAAQAPVAGTIYYQNIIITQDVLVARLGVFVAALNASDTWYLDVFKASDRSRLCGGTIVPNTSNSIISCSVTPTHLSANTEYIFALRSANGAGSFGYRGGYASSSTRLSGVVTGVTGATPSTLATGSSGSVCAYMEFATS